MSYSGMSGYWDRRLSRRRVLRGSALGLVGLAGAALVGCSSSKSSTSNAGAPANNAVATSAGGASAGGAGTAAPTAATAAAEKPRRGGTLKLGSRSQPGTMDPHFGGGGFDERYEWFVYDNLVTFDLKGNTNIEESLANAMEVPDPQTIVFKLRDGIKFHDGSPFNAELVKWNIDRSLDPKRSATAKPQFVHIKSVDAVDPLTVRFNLSQPDGTLVGALGGKGGMMVSRQAVEKGGDDQYARNPVGTGPFTFVSWVDQSELRFKRNDAYWRKGVDGGPAAYVDDVSLRIIPEAVVIASSIQSGEIDHIDEPAASNPDLSNDKNIQVQKFEGNGMILLFWNHGLAPLDNVDFRRAAAAAWDRATWSKIFFQGELKPADAMIPPGSWAYQAQPTQPKFDLAAAKASLDKSGVPESAREFRVAGAGDVWGGSNGVTLFVDNLAKAGIRVIYEPAAPASKTLKATNGDGTYNSVSSLSLRPDPDGWLTQLFREKSTYNLGFAATVGVEPLLDKAAASYDLKERIQIYSQVLKITADQMYSINPGLFRNGFQYSRKNVRGVRFGADGKGRLAQLWLAAT